MKDKKKLVLKVIAIILISLIVILVALIIYDRVTINNEYSIAEANIDIPIFVYHDIVKEDSQVEYDFMQTTQSKFEEQIKGLKDFGYNFITYDNLQKFKNNKIKLKKKSCILTFDDGFEGVYQNAYPIAKKYNIPFTIFIITQKMDTPGYLSWEQAKQLKESGLVTISSHSVDHTDFSKLELQEAVENVDKSYQIIEQNIGEEPIKIFTYPYGLYKEEQIGELEKKEYIQNLTDNRINKSKNLDLTRLHRCYPLSDSPFKIILKIFYRSIRY